MSVDTDHKKTGDQAIMVQADHGLAAGSVLVLHWETVLQDTVSTL